jgi:ribosomal-protein-alanine N-acetyltransferase
MSILNKREGYLKLNSEAIEIRRVIPDDIDVVMAIEAIAAETPWSRAHYEDGFKHHYEMYLMSLKYTPIGFVVMRWTSDQAEILNIAITPEYQGQGLGRCLLSHVIDIVKGKRVLSLFLEVRFSNKKAQKLYNALGFNEIGVRPAYYEMRGTKKREDAIVMGLEFYE